ncbi:hypothetical protein T4B_7264 [Trichinella pseudospiralis]|uniref:Uncharacterized protein n=2 Tax=Trichinella pseudospiralis TaxID=6337 RepID=A0A0V1FST3_TRIPS|nr:hypothetical protein T4D_4470 [Trichinella pseudospiralis]KRZ21306.1 hypothetical protein T4B_7264 [Trichinella pseudospiralis]KRZ37638.1 hypothetical protein T4C_6175 [Trichinella pseudospiralis]
MRTIACGSAINLSASRKAILIHRHHKRACPGVCRPSAYLQTQPCRTRRDCATTEGHRQPTATHGVVGTL